MRKATQRTTGALAVVLTIFAAGCSLSVKLPDYPATGKTVWLEQNWSPDQRNGFHHADQGTLTFGIPLEWFVALEQPSLSLRSPGLLSDPIYLDRFGFISASAEVLTHELPVGFASGGPMPGPDGALWINPRTGTAMTGVGFTCAACHTSRLAYRGVTLLVDGGPALANLDKLRTGVGLSLLYTRYVPFRFERFARRVLGPGADAAAKSGLRQQLDQVLVEVNTVKTLDDKVKAHSVEEGYARLDALNRIGNTVFALDLHDYDNYASTSAPVHFPHIWNAPWYNWVQYNGSIQQPMVRNAGEALGVAAPVDLVGPAADLYSSGVKLQTVFELETLLGGRQPDAAHGFSGLKSPHWPTDVLPPIDTKLAAQGGRLYRELCQTCHLPPVDDATFWSSEHWLPANRANERYLDLPMVDIKDVGTDPAQAEDMATRHVELPASLGIATSEFGSALGQLVEKTVDHEYDSQQPPVPVALRRVMNGNRPNGIRVPLAYLARPLNGIWATPPYLHNGSVPNLYALLSPVAERPAKFFLGNREYDPVDVGYRTEALAGGFEFDTRTGGNHNSGHEFADSPGKQGVIGRLLSPEERRALIEYLKTQ